MLEGGRGLLSCIPLGWLMEMGSIASMLFVWYVEDRDAFNTTEHAEQL